MRRKKCLPPPPGGKTHELACQQRTLAKCEKFWLTKFCRNFRLQQEQVTELCLQEALIVTVQARPAVVAFPQGSTCPRVIHLALIAGRLQRFEFGARARPRFTC